MKRVEVTWVDSTTLAWGWQELTDYLGSEAGPVEITTVGYLVGETPGYLTLVMALHEDRGNVGFVIPRGCVRKIRRLK